MGGGLYSVGALEVIDSTLRVACLQIKFAGNEKVILTFRIGRKDLREEALGFVVLAGVHVGLRQAGLRVKRLRIEFQRVIVSVNRFLGMACQTRGIAEQEPELAVLRCGRNSALRVIRCRRRIIVFESGFRSASEATDFDASAPTKAVCRAR